MQVLYFFSHWHNHQNAPDRGCSSTWVLEETQHEAEPQPTHEEHLASFDLISHWDYLVSQNNLLCPEWSNTKISEAIMKTKYINAFNCPTNSYQIHSMCTPVLSSEDELWIRQGLNLQGRTDQSLRISQVRMQHGLENSGEELHRD